MTKDLGYRELSIHQQKKLKDKLNEYCDSLPTTIPTESSFNEEDTL